MATSSRYSRQSLRKQLSWSEIDTDYLRQLIGLAKIEDLAGAGLAQRPQRLGDVTTALMPEAALGKAQLMAREPMVVCGLGLVQATLNAYGENCIFEASVRDGDRVSKGDCLGKRGLGVG